MALNFIKDNEPIYDTDKYEVVLVGVSTHNVLMGNFQPKVANKYPVVEKVYYSTPCGDMRKLGKRVTIDDLGDGKPIVSLMFICSYPSRKGLYLDYDALEKCLTTANAEFKGKRVMTTMLGTTRFDGKGDKDRCLEIIEKCCKDIDLYIYDYEQISTGEEIERQKKYFKKLRSQYRKDKEMMLKIRELEFEMRKRTYLPTRECFLGKKSETDNILNY